MYAKSGLRNASISRLCYGFHRLTVSPRSAWRPQSLEDGTPQSKVKQQRGSLPEFLKSGAGVFPAISEERAIGGRDTLCRRDRVWRQPLEMI